MNSLKQEAKFESLRSEAEVRRKVEGEEAAGEEDIASAFDTIVKDRKEKAVSSGRDKSLRHLRDEANYIPYQPADQHTEAGYSMMTGFAAQASGAVLDLTEAEDAEEKRRKVGTTVWDKKARKYVRKQDDKKRIKTESGVYIQATYKTNRYSKWKERSKLAQQEQDYEQEERGTKHGGGARAQEGPQGRDTEARADPQEEGGGGEEEG